MSRIEQKQPLPFAFYDDINKQNRYKAQCENYSHNEYLISSGCRFLPFQIRGNVLDDTSIEALTITMVNVNTGVETDVQEYIDSTDLEIIEDADGNSYISYFGKKEVKDGDDCVFENCVYYLIVKVSSKLAINGTFDTSTGWTLNGTAAISGGTLNITGNGLPTNRAVFSPLVPVGVSGGDYRLIYEVTANTLVGSGNLTTGSTPNEITPLGTTLEASVGVHSVDFAGYSVGTRTNLSFALTDGYTSGSISIDNVYIIYVGDALATWYSELFQVVNVEILDEGLIKWNQDDILKYGSGSDERLKYN